MVKTGNLFEILHLIRQVLDGGKHVDSNLVEYIKTRSLSIKHLDNSSRLLLNLDGEFGGDAPVHLYNLANHIEFFADTDLVSDHAITLDTEQINREKMAQRFIEETNHFEVSIK